MIAISLSKLSSVVYFATNSSCDLIFGVTFTKDCDLIFDFYVMLKIAKTIPIVLS